MAHRRSRFRSDREMSRRNEITVKFVYLRKTPAGPAGCVVVPFPANANSAWRSIAPFPRFIESTLGRLGVCRRFLPGRRAKAFYIPREVTLSREKNAATSDGHGREKKPVLVFSPASVSSPFFFLWNDLTLFLPYARHELRGRSIFPRVLIHAFHEGKLPVCRTILSRFSPLVLHVSHAFPVAKTIENFQQEVFCPLNANPNTCIKTSPLRIRENTKTCSVNDRNIQA